MKKIFQVAIDSPAASGAGTQAQLICKYYNFFYLDTGKLYRILGRLYLKNNKKINYCLFKNKIKKTKVSELKNKNILNNEIGMASAFLAKDKKIRVFVSEYQRKIANNPPKKYDGVCFDGRDITYKIMPKADVKIFMTAKVKIRARRRYLELKKYNPKVKLKDILESVEKRDKSDFTRKISPLKKTKDSILIDNSNMNIKECFNLIKKYINEALNNS